MKGATYFWRIDTVLRRGPPMFLTTIITGDVWQFETLADNRIIYVDDDGTMEAEPKSLLAGRQFGKGYPNENHVRNFLDCVKSRRTPIAPAEGAHRANSTCQVANICQLLGRKLTFDPATEQFVGDEMANRMVHRAMRAPWQLF